MKQFDFDESLQAELEGKEPSKRACEMLRGDTSQEFLDRLVDGFRKECLIPKHINDQDLIDGLFVAFCTGVLFGYKMGAK